MEDIGLGGSMELGGSCAKVGVLEVDLHSIGKYVSCSCLVPFLDMMLIIYMATLILSLSLFSFRTLSCYDIYGYPC